MTSITKLQFPASVSLVNLARQLTIAARIRKPVVAQLSQVNTTQNRHSSTSSSISTASRSTGGGSGQKRIPATYYRGGTSRGIIFEEQHLPSNREEWGPILRGALGSPDPSGRQLNGLGTGISSLSKVCVVGRSERADADVDYTFVQVGVREGELDYSSNCGNMSAAVGPFAVNGGLVGQLAAGASVQVQQAPQPSAALRLRIHLVEVVAPSGRTQEVRAIARVIPGSGLSRVSGSLLRLASHRLSAIIMSRRDDSFEGSSFTGRGRTLHSARSRTPLAGALPLSSSQAALLSAAEESTQLTSSVTGFGSNTTS